jgi:hypothetical protein
MVLRSRSRLIIVTGRQNQDTDRRIIGNESKTQIVGRYFGEDRFISDLERTLLNPTNI